MEESRLIESINSALGNETLVDAINNHALPRLYDYEILRVAESSNEIALLAIFVSICVMVVTAFLTWVIFRRQERIMSKQADIAEQQSKISSYDKKYDVYQFIYRVSKNVNESLIDKIVETLKADILPYNKFKSIFSALFLFQISLPEYEEMDYEKLVNIANQKFYDLIACFHKVNDLYLPQKERTVIVSELEIILHSLWLDIFCCDKRITKESLMPLLKICDLTESLKQELCLYENKKNINKE